MGCHATKDMGRANRPLMSGAIISTCCAWSCHVRRLVSSFSCSFSLMMHFYASSWCLVDQDRVGSRHLVPRNPTSPFGIACFQQQLARSCICKHLSGSDGDVLPMVGGIKLYKHDFWATENFLTSKVLIDVWEGFTFFYS